MESLPEFGFEEGLYDLKDLQFLGSGTYGKVYRSKILKTAQPIAIKQINMTTINNQGLVHSLKQQISIMKQLKSPNIVHLIDYSLGDNYTYMILELCENDLRKAMQKRKQKFSEQECIEIFGEILRGFKVMIEKSCIHRDVKPENVLIKNENYKLADFGFACKADMYGKQKIQDICGTPIYMAPQLLRGQPYTAKCDIWSLGLMLYELIYGYTPWPMKCPETYLQSIKKRSLAFPFGVKIGKQTKDFLKKTLISDQQKRLGWQQLFKHPLVAKKLAGEAQTQKQLPPKIRRLLSTIQKQGQRKFINQIDIFKKYAEFKVLNFDAFSELMKELNPTITSFQINLLFEACDNNNSKQIDRQQFQNFFCTVDYRTDPQYQKQIDELVGIVLTRDLQLEELFQQNDFNQTGALDSKQFQSLIKAIAPKYSNFLIRKLYNKFDKDGNGLISKAQFLQIFARGVVNQKNYVGMWSQRATRNLKTLRFFINDRQLSIQKIMEIADINLDQHIDRQQFAKLLTKIQFKITSEEIDQIFKLIDKNDSSKISLIELKSFMK